MARTIQVSAHSTPVHNNTSSRILKTKKSHKTLLTFESQAKKKRRKPGQVVQKQIKYYRNTTALLLRVLPFARIVKEIGNALAPREFGKYLWKSSAIDVLRSAAEAYIVALFEDTNKAATHAKRVTIRPEDLHLIRDVRSRVCPNEML